jgi:hypothetical protein
MSAVVKAAVALCLFGVSAPALAGWQDAISPPDAGRLEKLIEARNAGLAEAERGAAAADLAVIHSVLGARAVPASAKALTGAWRCRQMKLGGATPDIVYSWFSCRIDDKSGVLAFEKINGSARTAGTLYPAGAGFVYLGAQSVKDEPRHVYSGNRAQAGGDATPDDQVGLLSLLADGRARLEMPYPTSKESTFDVIELKR